MPHLARIVVYPIKSLDGLEVSQARVLPCGALENDRRWALVDQAGKFVNAKRTAAIHGIGLRGDLLQGQFTLFDRCSGEGVDWRIGEPVEPLEAWLSARLGLSLALVERTDGGFPDDPDAPGPTVIGQASLQRVAEWFALPSASECRARFRANLELAAPLPFWEDRLCGPPGQPVPFRFGNVELLGTNPCQRCVVPTRSPTNGEPHADFVAQFRERRAAELPAWACRERFDHFYRLAVNTAPVPGFAGGLLTVGDACELAALA